MQYSNMDAGFWHRRTFNHGKGHSAAAAKVNEQSHPQT